MTSSPLVKSVMVLTELGISATAIQNWSAPAPPLIVLPPPEVTYAVSVPAPPNSLSSLPRIRGAICRNLKSVV
ncbi:MAG: hypothetical protein WBA39_13645 [Rivularia sp. (in: cyanobacteria)]